MGESVLNPTAPLLHPSVLAGLGFRLVSWRTQLEPMLSPEVSSKRNTRIFQGRRAEATAKPSARETGEGGMPLGLPEGGMPLGLPSGAPLKGQTQGTNPSHPTAPPGGTQEEIAPAPVHLAFQRGLHEMSQYQGPSSLPRFCPLLLPRPWPGCQTHHLG